MEFKEVIRNRFSCRKYSAREIEREKLDAVLEADARARAYARALVLP